MIVTGAPRGRYLQCSHIGIDCEIDDFHILIVPGAARSQSDALPTRDLVQQLADVDTRTGLIRVRAPSDVGGDQEEVGAARTRFDRIGADTGTELIPGPDFVLEKPPGHC